MSDQIKRTALALLTAIALLATATAAANQQLDVRTVVQKEEVVRTDSGEAQTQLVPTETVLPGDKVVYTITFTNIGDAAADDVTVTNPIDRSLSYVEGSAFGAGMTIEFSVDGGQTWGDPSELTVADNGGRRAAAPEEYTHLRWTLDGELPPGATGVARFSATID